MPPRDLDRRRAIDAGVARRKSFELRKCSVKQPNPARKRAALHVVIRGGELDETLKKEFFVAFGAQPALFPRLMRVPEVVTVEKLDACSSVIPSHCNPTHAFLCAAPRRSPG